MTTTPLPDPRDLALDDLRRLRQQLQHEDDVVSYARRVAQARLDLVQAELAQRRSGADAGDVSVDEGLRGVLSRQLTGGPPRPPRPTEDLSDDPLAIELDEVCSAGGFGRLSELDADELSSLAASIGDFEARVSSDRRERFDRLDALSAELVRRYREGEADVRTLFDD